MASGDLTPGVRLPDGDHTADAEPGNYWKNEREAWEARTPNGRVANFSGHTITENEDATITVTPLIRADEPPRSGAWYGYLEAGVWRER